MVILGQHCYGVLLSAVKQRLSLSSQFVLEGYSGNPVLLSPGC